MKRYGLRDDQFARIETLLPGRPGTVGRSSELGNRLFVEAVIWKFRSGAPWRDLPSAVRSLQRTLRARFAHRLLHLVNAATPQSILRQNGSRGRDIQASLSLNANSRSL